MSRRSRVIWSGIVLASFPLSVAAAQEARRDAEIRGIVVRATDRTALVGVAISLEGQDLVVLSDKNGKFKFPKVAAGTYLVRAEVEGYPAATTTVVLAAKDRIEIEFRVGVSDAQALPDLEVEADQPRISPIAEFNRRVSEGRGHYFTRADIERRNPPTLYDLMRAIPGVRVSCPAGVQNRCVLRLHRWSCGPSYWIDGVPTHASVLYMINPSDLEGVEVYSGPAQTPIELTGGGRNECGTVAIWTRRSAPRPPGGDLPRRR